jgi:hypothetical protein
MGNQKHRIRLQADSNSEQVSSEFAKKHKLNDVLKAKLKEQLDENLR